MISDKSIETQLPRHSIGSIARSSIDLPSGDIILKFFSVPSDELTNKHQLLNNFRSKIMADFTIQNHQIDQKIEEYFANMENFKNIDQEFLKEMLLNGYIPSDNLIKIFNEKKFEFLPITTSIFENKERKFQKFDLKIENFSREFYEQNLQLNHQQTENLRKSIETGLEGLEQDKQYDTANYQIMLINLADHTLPIKLIGIARLLKNPNLILSPTKDSLINADEELLYYPKWNSLLRNIGKEINKNKFQANAVIRISQDNADRYNFDITNLQFCDSEERYKTSCYCGIIKFCQDFFSKFLNKPTQSPSLNQRHLINLSSSSNSNNSSVLLD